tara:strand:+ start:1548 stop:3656 length:2109 start_codon:yes stop_codon:yes gene_type:complete
MASGGTIEIDVELSGTQNIKEGFGKINDAGKALAENMGSTNEKLGEGIAGIGESVFGLSDSFGELGSIMKQTGESGSISFLAMIGPLAGIATAAFAAFETIKLLSGKTQELEENQSAMAAAAADLQGKLEALAEKGVVLAANEMERFTKMTLLAQVAKEKLQFSQEKLTKKVMRFIEAEKKLERVRERIEKLRSGEIKQAGAMAFAREELAQATRNLTEAEKDFNVAIKTNIEDQKRLSSKIAEAEEDYVGFEETSAAFLETKVKENIETRKSLKLADQETRLSEKKFKVKKIEIEQESALALLKLKGNTKNREALLTQNKALEQELKGLNAVNIANRQAQFQKDQLRKANMKTASDAAARRKAAAIQEKLRLESLAKTEKQNQLKRFSESSRIEQLRLESLESGFDKEVKLIQHRYKTATKIAGNNLNQALIARLEFNNQMNQLIQKDNAQKEKLERESFLKSTQIKFDQDRFEAESIQNSFVKENELLRINYEEKLALAKGNQEQITQLQKRYGIERERLVGRENSKIQDQLDDFFGGMGRGMAEAAAGALVMGESFKKSIGTLLMSLSKQAAVESLMELAKGTATALNPLTAKLSAGHFKASAIFAGAAVVAGASGSALGAGGSSSGGGSVGGGGGISSAESAPAIERNQATSSELVFNVNFSGAVIYDTKKAAEEALSNRVIQMMNSNRRGAPRNRRS